MCLYLLENPRKKESVVSELARGCISKFLLVDSNRMLVVYVAIVKLRFFHSGFRFILRIDRLNPPQVFTVWFLGSSYHCVIYISTALHDMIYMC